MNIMKRGLLAVSALAIVGGTAGGLLASSAGAAPRAGIEVIHATQYSVGGGLSVGPWTSSRGPVTGPGNATDIPSRPLDPPNSGRTTLVDPNGSITVLHTGGTFVPGRENPFTCAFTGRVNGVNVTIVRGTGDYRNATGNLLANVRIQGTQPRRINGTCNFNANNSAFETDSITAVGFVNLH
jgi:hypothetical protein